MPGACIAGCGAVLWARAARDVSAGTAVLLYCGRVMTLEEMRRVDEENKRYLEASNELWDSMEESSWSEHSNQA